MTRRSQETQLRIQGVVKSMNEIRQWLSARSDRPLTLDEQRQITQQARSIAAQIERICRKQRVKPEALPTPTYQAYLFLKNLDVTRPSSPVTGTAATRKPPPPAFHSIRVQNLVAACQQFQEQLAQAAPVSELASAGKQKSRHTSSKNKSARDWIIQPIDETRLQALRQRAAQLADQTEAICHTAGSNPLALPAPSRRAYQWLRFLCDEANMRRHLTSLGVVLHRLQSRLTQSGANWKLPVKFQFYHLPALYRARQKGKTYWISANEAFIAAPAEILDALIVAALWPNQTEALEQVRAFGDSAAFAHLQQALEGPNQPPAGNDPLVRGQAYDLEQVFARVNDQYFNGELERPILRWNSTPTRRKLGHYQPATNILMISITLDDPDQPEYLIDFVVYHELLHKHLGMRLVNGRRYSHHREFREAERKFRQYEQAQQALQILARSQGVQLD